MAEVAAEGNVLSPYGRRSTGVGWRKRSPFCVGFPRCSPSLGIDHGRGSSCSNNDESVYVLISKAMKWWEMGLQPNTKEIESAQDLVDSLSNAPATSSSSSTTTSSPQAAAAAEPFIQKNLANGYVFKGKSMIIQFGGNPCCWQSYLNGDLPRDICLLKKGEELREERGFCGSAMDSGERGGASASVISEEPLFSGSAMRVGGAAVLCPDVIVRPDGIIHEIERLLVPRCDVPNSSTSDVDGIMIMFI